MMELALLVLSGILGSSHCVGMCGGFVLALSRPKQSLVHNLLRQSLYTCGRVSTYGLLGAMAGWCGQEILAWQPLRNHGGAILAFLAGSLLIYQGLVAAGVWPHRFNPATTGSCWWSSILRPILTGQRLPDVFVAGVLTGFIPCGLVYAMLSLAASSHNLVHGMLVMMAFAAGTAPALVLTGVSGLAVPLAWRKPVWRLAAWCLVATGIIALVRGGYALANASRPAPACPFCAADE